MKSITYVLMIIFAGIFMNSCTSFEDKVQEYGAVQENIAIIHEEVSAGEKDPEVGVAEISELKLQLEDYDQEVIEQYNREEEIRREIEVNKREYQEKVKTDSIKQARIDDKEARELKRLEEIKAREEKERLQAEELKNRNEVAAMIAAEEEADRNLYLYELEEKGLFLIDFDGEYYEVNKKEWAEWKRSENYDPAKTANEYKVMFSSMGYEKANELANSMYRTLSKKIAREGISYKAIQGIQVYNLMTMGELVFE